MKSFTLLIYSVGTLLTFSMHSMEKPKKPTMTVDPAQYRLLERLDQAIRGSSDDTAQIPPLLQQITINLLTPLHTGAHHHTILHSAVLARDPAVFETIITSVRQQAERDNAQFTISPHDSRQRTPYMLAHELGDDGKEIVQKMHTLFPEKRDEFDDDLEYLGEIHKKARESQKERNVRAQRLEEIRRESSNPIDNDPRAGRLQWAPASSVRQQSSSETPARSCMRGARFKQAEMEDNRSEQQKNELFHVREGSITQCMQPVMLCTALLALVLYFTYLASSIQPTVHRNLP